MSLVHTCFIVYPPRRSPCQIVDLSTVTPNTSFNSICSSSRYISGMLLMALNIYCHDINHRERCKTAKGTILTSSSILPSFFFRSFIDYLGIRTSLLCRKHARMHSTDLILSPVYMEISSIFIFVDNHTMIHCTSSEMALPRRPMMLDNDMS